MHSHLDGAAVPLDADSSPDHDGAEESSPARDLTASGRSQLGSFRHSRHIACLTCRRMKIRCDGSATPCARCQRLGLRCERYMGNAREHGREKIKSLELQVQQLRSMIQQPESQIAALNFLSPETVEPTVASNATATQSAITEAPLSAIPVLDNPLQGFLSIDDFVFPFDDLCPSRSLGQNNVLPPTKSNGAPLPLPRTLCGVKLPIEQIDELFRLYFQHFHPFLPFLDVKTSPDHVFEQSPLLFWTIIGVAARRYPDDITLRTALVNPIMKLVWSAAATPPFSLYTVQALLLQTAWPFPTSSTVTNVAIYLCGLAVTGAMQLGLHQPGTLAGFSRNVRATLSDEILRERTATWAACNIMAQHMAASFGHPRLAQFGGILDCAYETGNNILLPQDLHHQMVLQRFCDRVTSAMSSDSSDPIGLPSAPERRTLLLSLETELDSVERQFGQWFSPTTQLYAVAARFYLHLFHFFEEPDSEFYKDGILRAYNAANVLISDVTAAHASSDMLLYVPIQVSNILFAAGNVLLKVTLSEYGETVGIDAGKKAFSTAVVALRRCSVENNDHAARAAEILAQSWAMFSLKRPGRPILRVNTRLAASLVFDCLWNWRHEFPEDSDGYVAATAPHEHEAGSIDMHAVRRPLRPM